MMSGYRSLFFPNSSSIQFFVLTRNERNNNRNKGNTKKMQRSAIEVKLEPKNKSLTIVSTTKWSDRDKDASYTHIDSVVYVKHTNNNSDGDTDQYHQNEKENCTSSDPPIRKAIPERPSCRRFPSYDTRDVSRFSKRKLNVKNDKKQRGRSLGCRNK